MQDIPSAHLFPDKFPYLVVAILYEVEVDAHQSLDMVFVVIAHRHLELFEFGDDAALREVDVTLDEAVEIFLRSRGTVFLCYGVGPFRIGEYSIRNQMT